MQILLSVVDQLVELKLGVEEPLQEAALVLIWRQLQEREERGVPSLKLVIKGDINLLQAYKQIQVSLEPFGQVFLASSLPNNISGNDLAGLLNQVLQAPKMSDVALFDALSEQVIKDSKTVDVLPIELVQLMASLTTSDKSDVYLPLAGSAQLAVKLASSGREVSLEASSFDSLLFSAASLLKKVSGHQSDPIRAPSFVNDGELKEFSNVVMTPPFGVRYKDRISDSYGRFQVKATSGEALAIQHALSQCSGRLVTWVSTGCLFRMAGDYDLRKKLIGNGWIDAIIQFPSGLLSFSSIPLAVLVIDKNRDGNAPVFFCEANQKEWVKQGGRGKRNLLIGWKEISELVSGCREHSATALVSRDEIESNKYGLTVSRYVLGKASKSMQRLAKKEGMVPLEVVADLIRAQALKEEETPQGDEYFEVGAKDFSDDGYVTEPKKCLRLSGRAKDRAELQKLQSGDLLFTSKGNIGRVALVGGNCGANWVANQSYQVVRLKKMGKVESPEYLYSYLTSPLVRGYLNEKTTGSAMPILSTEEIKGLPVPVVSPEREEQVRQTHNEMVQEHQRISKIRQNIESLNQSHWPFVAESA